MRLEIFIIGITALFIYNAYSDGKYMKLLMTFKKYYQMIFFAVLGVSIYLLLKRNPLQGRNMLLYANNVVKYMPIDKTTMDMITPVFDFTSKGINSNDDEGSFMESFNDINPLQRVGGGGGEKRMLNSGSKGTKRSVSETKKKYVASQQEWKCGECRTQLDHTFEIDHKLRLEYGGGNDVQNLIALCRNCHGKKTAMENM
jgi:hypothetical protein